MASDMPQLIEEVIVTAQALGVPTAWDPVEIFFFALTGYYNSLDRGPGEPHTVTIFFNHRPRNPITHVGFSFDKGTIYGFAPINQNNLANVITETLIHPVPGTISANPSSEFQDSITFPISEAQYSEMTGYVAANWGDYYSTLGTNCAEFASNMLAAGGIYSIFYFSAPLGSINPILVTPTALDFDLRTTAINTGG